jgi:signal transduction histidine kinase
MARRLERSHLKGYLCAVLLVAAAAILTLAIKPFFGGKAPLVFFTIAVTLAAAYGGIGSGLLTTALSVGVALFLFQDHVFALVMAQSSLTLFVVIGVAVTFVVGRLRGLNAALIQARDQLEVSNKGLELANERLLQQGVALSHANEELQQFAYGLAHDFNNPLRSIGALTDLLIDRNAEKFDERSKDCARMIVGGVQRMESMIKSLLDYAAAVESHGDRVVADCNTVVERALQDLHLEIEATGTLVNCDRLPIVTADETHLVQVFSNLVGNAIKYRSAQKPEIHISVRDQGADWLFAVRDNGIGFEMQYADNIFGMFKRLHSSDTFKGSGMGLSLCKAVIQCYGGRIWAESAPGQGSTFFFTLPVAADQHDSLRKPPLAEQTPLRKSQAATQGRQDSAVS